MFDINLMIDNFIQNPNYNGTMKLENFELSLLNLLSEYAFLPENIRKTANQVKFNKGKINLNASVKNNSFNASTNLGGIEFTYIPLSIPIKINNGSLFARKNYLGINRIDLIADDMPILIDGGINDIFAKRDMNLNINSNLSQKFLDNYIKLTFLIYDRILNNEHLYKVDQYK